ncbi:MAG: Dolichyl-phosphate-mannose-protein mannosyltransferase [Chthoniobacter sp.]|nr:Dolichyl-phosphate-mannose-protein mannosyltransferase [Chthoniobacter sp.]
MSLSASRVRSFLAAPPRGAEVIVWLLVVAAVVGIRVYLVHLLPTILWSRDSGSYMGASLRWMHGAVWESDPRRGPIYSLLIAGCLAAWKSFDALMVVQHVLGGIAVLTGIVLLRLMHTRRAIFVIGLCGYAYAVYALPLLMEHLLRNETLLFLFSSLIFASWYLAVAREEPHWLWIAGISAGLMQLTKAVFAPLPLVLIALHLWFYRKQPKLAAKQVIIFVLAFVLPLVGAKIHHQLTGHRRPPEPQSGILLYGRTAQFTVLDSGIEPEVKTLIRQEVEDYKKLPKLDNNMVLKRTIVPKLTVYYRSIHKTPTDLNRLCRQLAVEGIKANKLAYVKQVLQDLKTLHFKSGFHADMPNANDVLSSELTLQSYTRPDPLMHKEESLAIMQSRHDKPHFATYRHRTKEAWLFSLKPVFLTSLLLPVFIYFTRDKRRLWWLGAAAMWYFTLILLSTVGRPLDRYLLPGVPIMFCTLCSAVIFVSQWLFDRIAERAAKTAVHSPQYV